MGIVLLVEGLVKRANCHKIATTLIGPAGEVRTHMLWSPRVYSGREELLHCGFALQQSALPHFLIPLEQRLLASLVLCLPMRLKVLNPQINLFCLDLMMLTQHLSRH